MNKDIYKIALECKRMADQQIEVIRTIIPRGNIIYTDYTVTGNVREYEQKLLCLKDVMKDKYPELCFQMQEHMEKYDTDNIVHLSALEAILDTKCCSFLTADCKYDDLKGTIDRQYISIKVNGDDVKDRMNEFIYKVLDYFELPQIEMLKFSQWEADRDKFIKEACNY